MNSFNQRLRVSTFGESHGSMIGCVMDGVPAGLCISLDRIQEECDRRRGGRNPYSTQRKERDRVEILSGVFDGKSTGTPLAMIIANHNNKSKDYESIKEVFRPSHADFTYFHKYGIRDYRGGGRASARETAVRVASGAVAKILLEHFGIFVESGILSIGDVEAREIDFDFARKSEIFSLDPEMEGRQKELIKSMRKAEDSIGGVALIRARGVPIGLGEGLYYKLSGAIGSMMMGLNGVKAVEIGDGFSVSKRKGSQNNDGMDERGFLSNRCGGILGGMSNGEEILIRVYFKPTPSIALLQKTQNIYKEQVCIRIQGRHDPCIAVRGSVVCESMLALILADMLLLHATSRLDFLERIYAA